MRIRCLRTGVVREREGTRGIGRYLRAAWRDEALPVNAFLVEHPAGLCLFDAGQTARATMPGYFPWWQPFFRLARFELEADDELAVQLAALGIQPLDVRWIVLSHLHTDHVGGLETVPASDVLVSSSEWERGRGLRGRIRGYLPQHWPKHAEPHLLDLANGAFGPFPGSFDIAGDGSLIVVATPGHTPGHISLLVRQPGAEVLLGGDLAHSSRDLPLVAPEVGEYCVEHGIVYVGAHDWDAETTLESTDGESGAPMLTPHRDGERT